MTKYVFSGNINIEEKYIEKYVMKFIIKKIN